MSIATTVAIVGSAGRKEDARRMNSDHFTFMLNAVQHQIEEVWRLSPTNVRLVSGGAAFADHVAVALHRLRPQHYSRLTLHLPVPFNTTRTAFDAAGIGSFSNAGHRTFCRQMGWNENQSLLELCRLSSDGVNVIVSEPARVAGASPPGVSSYFDRNRVVAQSDYLIAFTFTEAGATQPKEGGTAHTFAACRGTKVHIPLVTP
jgi:hypothetical protein